MYEPEAESILSFHHRILLKVVQNYVILVYSVFAHV